MNDSAEIDAKDWQRILRSAIGMARISKLAKQPFVVMPAVAIGVFGAWFAVQNRGGSSAASTLPTDTVVPVTVGTLAKTVSAQGTVAVTFSTDTGTIALMPTPSVDIPWSRM